MLYNNQKTAAGQFMPLLMGCTAPSPIETEDLLTDYSFKWHSNLSGEDFTIRNLASGLSLKGSEVTTVNVEPIYLNENGVGNPIAVRRRTIQPMYDKNDVTAVMQAFDKKLF